MAVLRGDGDEAHRVSFFELFFDLVYVFAVTQLSHGLAGHLTLGAAFQTLILLLAVWWAWVYTAWATNWLDPDHRAVRLLLIGVMGCGLVMAASIPDAFGERGIHFALAYALIQAGRTSFVLWAFRDQPIRHENFRRILVWNAIAAAVWVAGGMADPSVRPAIWLVALAVDYAGPAARFWVPILGRSRTTDWQVTGGHFAERFKLFIILALGESILITGATVSELELTNAVIAAFAVAFAGSVAMWWIYFDRAAEAGAGALERADDPGRLARSAYTYFHLPIVAGIIVAAVADEIIITHPEGLANGAVVAVILGGPALFLAGHALYKWAVWGLTSLPRLAAIVMLALLVPVGPLVSPLLLAFLATLVLVAVNVADLRAPATAHDPPEATGAEPTAEGPAP